MNKSIIVVVLLIFGCLRKHELPPPIDTGKCLVDIYTGGTATKQTCLYGGYTWSCTADSCERVAEVGGERPPVTIPQSPASDASDASAVGSALHD